MKALHIAMIMMSALLATACLSEQEDIFDVPLDGHTFFEADFEDVGFPGNSDRLWERNVGIGVFGSVEGMNEKYTLKKAFDSKRTGEFYGPKVSGEKIKAYYPYSEDFSLLDGNLSYTLAPHQEFDGTTSMYDQFCRYSKVVYAFCYGNGKLKFCHASGLLSVQTRLDVSKIVKSISISSDQPLAGIGYVADDMSVTMAGSASRTIMLDCGDGVVSKNGDVYSKFPVVMPAGVYENLRVVLTFDNDEVIESEYDSIEVERVTASDCQVREIIVSNGLGGFEVEGDLEFEPRL